MSRLVFSFKVIKKILKLKRTNILHYGGLHLITGATGSGKTLLSSLIIDDLCRDEKSFFWSNVDQYDKEKTRILKLDEIIKEGTQVKRLYNTRCKGLMLDEINLSFNRRNNGKKDYNNIFLGLIELSLTHRHQGIPRIYYIGQAELLQDIQLQRIFKYKHVIAKATKWSYYFYEKDDVIIRIPKRLYVMSYSATEETGKWRFVKKQKIKITAKMLENYNTYGFAERFSSLPIYKGQ